MSKTKTKLPERIDEKVLLAKNLNQRYNRSVSLQNLPEASVVARFYFIFPCSYE